MINETAQKQIDYIAERCKEIKPLVVISCLTYNHELYLKDALEGFIMQKTDFPFIAIVHEDASTDKTAVVLKEYAEKYPNIIFPIYEKENLYSKRDGSLREIIHTARDLTGAKYVAFCEGDDYWIDPLKLQKQVSFLEFHPDYSACISKFICYNQVLKKNYAISGEKYKSMKDMLWNDFQFSTATLVSRIQLLKKYIEEIKPENKNWLMGDKPLLLFLSKEGLIETLDDCTTIYRILPNSASHSSDVKLQLKRAHNTINIYQYFADTYLGNDIALSKKIKGALLYREFLIYKKTSTKIPQEKKREILKYKGKYHKIYIVKFLIKFPFLINYTYKLIEIKHKIKLLFSK